MKEPYIFIVRPVQDLLLNWILQLKLSAWIKKFKKSQQYIKVDFDVYPLSGYLDLNPMNEVPYCSFFIIFQTDKQIKEFSKSPESKKLQEEVIEALKNMGVKSPYVEYASEEDIQKSGGKRWEYFK